MYRVLLLCCSCLGPCLPVLQSCRCFFSCVTCLLPLQTPDWLASLTCWMTYCAVCGVVTYFLCPSTLAQTTFTLTVLILLTLTPRRWFPPRRCRRPLWERYFGCCRLWFRCRFVLDGVYRRLAPHCRKRPQILQVPSQHRSEHMPECTGTVGFLCCRGYWHWSLLRWVHT